MFGRNKKSKLKSEPYDKTGKIPVIRASICTGEKVAGFKDKETGRFTEMMCIKSDADMRAFMDTYDVTESEIRREW